MIGTFFKLVGKAVRMAVHRPIQRFNIFNRVKKHLGEDAKYFMPAPRAIGAQSLRTGKPPLQYPHLEGSSGFKSIKQRRLDAITERNQKLLSLSTQTNNARASGQLPRGTPSEPSAERKSFSETPNDDDLVISISSRLPVVRTVTVPPPPATATAASESESPPSAGGEITPEGELVAQDKSRRPLPKLTSLQLSDPAVIWQVDKVPPGRLDLSKLQELLINKLADDTHWTPKKISETYNIKEEYAENLITYFKQIRIIISPKMAKALDYVGRRDPAYQATKHVIYQVDKRLRSEFDKQFDKTFLPTDELDPEVRELLDAGNDNAGLQVTQQPVHSRLANLIRRPEPLRLEHAGSQRPGQLEDGATPPPPVALEEQTQELGPRARPKAQKPAVTKKRLATPLNVQRAALDEEPKRVTQDTAAG